MNISSMYVKRGLAHLFSDTFKSTKKIDTLDKKNTSCCPAAAAAHLDARFWFYSLVLW